MGLKILAAGCSKEDRERVEPRVKAVLGKRPGGESWVVSLVKTRELWSVTLDGPDNRLRGFTFLSPEQRLSSSLTEALQNAGFLAPSASPSPSPSPGGAPSPPPARSRATPPPSSLPRPGPAGERRDRHECADCGKPFLVCYEAQANEAQVSVSVACPHCWERNVVVIGQWAATGKDYRAEKAGP